MVGLSVWSAWESHRSSVRADSLDCNEFTEVQQTACGVLGSAATKASRYQAIPGVAES